MFEGPPGTPRPGGVTRTATVPAVAAPALHPPPTGAYGGFWVRAMGCLIDGLINAAIALAAGMALGVPLGAWANQASADPEQTIGAMRPIFYASGIALNFLYFTVLWGCFGATFGQHAMRLRVVDASSGGPISVGRAAARWAGLVISCLLCFAGVLWVAADARKQGWMDKLASTVVVRA